MTSLPQTRQWTFTAEDGRHRATTASVSAEGSAPARARQALPAVDPSMAFGCVDWFLYPEQAVGRSATEAQRIPA
jgi:hypothetical protein